MALAILLTRHRRGLIHLVLTTTVWGRSRPNHDRQVIVHRRSRRQIGLHGLPLTGLGVILVGVG